MRFEDKMLALVSVSVLFIGLAVLSIFVFWSYDQSTGHLMVKGVGVIIDKECVSTIANGFRIKQYRLIVEPRGQKGQMVVADIDEISYNKAAVGGVVVLDEVIGGRTGRVIKTSARLADGEVRKIGGVR